MGKRGKTIASRSKSATPVYRSYQAVALVPIKNLNISATRCMALLHFHGPAPVEYIFNPLLYVHGVQGQFDPTLPYTASTLPPSAVTPFPEYHFTFSDHLTPAPG